MYPNAHYPGFDILCESTEHLSSPTFDPFDPPTHPYSTLTPPAVHHHSTRSPPSPHPTPTPIMFIHPNRSVSRERHALSSNIIPSVSLSTNITDDVEPEPPAIQPERHVIADVKLHQLMDDLIEIHGVDVVTDFLSLSHLTLG